MGLNGEVNYAIKWRSCSSQRCSKCVSEREREREREREILVFVRNKSFLVVALGGERVENTDENVKDLRS